MKKITINDQTFQYQVFYTSNYGYYTYFYSGTILRRKYGLFGKKIEVPKWVFTLGYSIESPNYTKEKIRIDLLDKIKLIEREQEIARGEII